ncbi:LD-carboxypeptidase [Cyanobium sp. HWJ4-Hawea]|uniref:S66 peptidase family protein n=1 Tax=Cyanobium sp. HWJ4-Hawea TaxID=2823713 RepID=UPI0020CC53E4|nr:LD-carboxypeptidase [Cyanobium sp. HWJ4-Hawea]MCP9807828.1 LD-carboxypeptidase [Cyanobium sp. HWJ4-Hawea]
MQNLALPKPLQAGDRVDLVAASSCLEGQGAIERLEAGIAILESWGLLVERRPLRSWGYLAGRDDERASDLKIPSANGASLLACIRGGWGSARLLEQPLDLPQAWLLGFSDVTSLLWAQLAQQGRGAIHGPLLTTLAAEPSWSQERLRRLLFGEPLEDLQGQGWRGGCAAGPLLVANLTVATHLLGTAHLPELRGAILVLEDVGEAPYRIDRMLTHWRLTGALQQLAGMGLGSFRGCDGEGDSDGAAVSSFSLEEVLRERTADLAIPVVAGLKVGHGDANAALPLGVRAVLDGDRGLLQLPDFQQHP